MLRMRFGWKSPGVSGRTWSSARTLDELHLGLDGAAFVVTWPAAGSAERLARGGDLRAPMPGVVLVVAAVVGDRVRAGDTVLVIESMKLELAVTAPGDGVVSALGVAVGDAVVRDQQLGHVEVEG